MTIGEGIAGYQVILVRPAEMTPDRHSAVGTLLLRMDGGLTPGDFDWVATRLASGQAGFQEEQGPHVGEETRWFVGPWPPQNPAEESRVVVVHHGEYVLSIVVGGPMGTAGQERVMSYASTVIDRLQRLGPEART
jgi:hypothetical protein